MKKLICTFIITAVTSTLFASPVTVSATDYNKAAYDAGKSIYGVEPEGNIQKPNFTSTPATSTPSVTPLPTSFYPQSTTSLIVGDVNSNGSFDSIDMGIVRQYLLGIPTIIDKNGMAATLANVDGISGINSLDLAYMRKRILGQIDRFPVPDLIM